MASLTDVGIAQMSTLLTGPDPSAIGLPGWSANTNASSVLGLPGGASTTAAGTTKPYPVTQSERLFTIRARSYVTHNEVGDGGDRGTRAYIRLMTNGVSKPFTRQSEPGQPKPSSLGTQSSGALHDIVSGNNVKENGYADGYASFILTGMSCSMAENIQVTQVIGDAEVIYYFGRNPVVMNFNGMLVDSVDNNWFIQWLELYSLHMRGTQLARNYELLKIVLPNMTLVGTISAFGWQQDASNDVHIPFQFQFQVKQLEPTPAILDTTAIISEMGLVTFSANDPVSLSVKAQNALKSQSAILDLTSALANPTNTLGKIANLFGEASQPSSSSVSKWIDGLTNTSSPGSPTSGLTNLLGGVNSNLTGIRASLFSPVFGVMSSLTKLIKNVTGSIQSVVGAFTNPVNNLLRDINSFSSQAVGLVNMVNSSINSITGMVTGTAANINATLIGLKNASGVISSAPTTVGQSLRTLLNSGTLSSKAAFLQGSSLISKLPPAFLATGGGVSRSSSSAALFSGSTTSNPKTALLNSSPPSTAQSGAKL